MSKALDKDKLSVVIPVCEQGENLPELLTEYLGEIQSVSSQYEVLIALNMQYHHLNDRLEQIAKENQQIKIILFSRNYGEGTILQALFEQCTGDYILILPPYKQVETNEIRKLFDAVDQGDLVLARRWPRLDSGFKQKLTKMFSGMANKLTDQHYSDPGCHVKLLSRESTKELNLYGDQHRFIHLLAYELGYKSVEVDLTQARENTTRNNPGPGLFVRRTLDLITIVFLTKFNKKPLRFFGILGSSSIALGFLGLLYLTYERFFYEIGMADRPLLVLFSLFLVLGIQLIGIGLIGETIIFTHAGKRKEYRIKKIFND